MRKEISIWLSKIPLIRKYLLNEFFRMTTAGNTKGKIRTVMMRSRRYFIDQDNPLFDIYTSMLPQPEISGIII
jgi:hypothetical protein